MNRFAVWLGAGLLALTLLVGCATTPAPTSVRYEAEAATIVNSAHKKADAPPGTERQSFYSGGLAAGGLNTKTKLAEVAPDWSNVASVVFAVNVSSAGNYALRIAYNGDDNKTILVRTNGGDSSPVSVPRVGDGTWNLMHAKMVPVVLRAGANTVAISGSLEDAGWLNIDYIELAPSAP